MNYNTSFQTTTMKQLNPRLWLCTSKSTTSKATAMIDIQVSEKNTPLERNTLGNIGFQSAKSGTALPFLPLDCRTKAHLKEMTSSQTPVGIITS